MKHELILSACSEHHGGTLHSAQEIRGKALALGPRGLQLALSLNSTLRGPCTGKTSPRSLCHA